MDEVYFAYKSMVEMQYTRAWPAILIPLIREGKGAFYRNGERIREPVTGDWKDVTWICKFEKIDAI